jgi:hypothetical protein
MGICLQKRDGKILKQGLTLPRQMITNLFLPLKAMAYSSVYTWSSSIICYRHVPVWVVHAARTTSLQTRSDETGVMLFVPA